jgi:hypothetical protein
MLDLHDQQHDSGPFIKAHHLQAVQAKWDRLTAGDVSHIRDRGELIERVSERYSLPREQAERDVAIWLTESRF